MPVMIFLIGNVFLKKINHEIFMLHTKTDDDRLMICYDSLCI